MRKPSKRSKLAEWRAFIAGVGGSDIEGPAVAETADAPNPPAVGR